MITIRQSIKSVKDKLTSQDILVFEFESDGGKKFAAIYADGLIDKHQNPHHHQKPHPPQTTTQKI